jgi:hypothetical protein
VPFAALKQTLHDPLTDLGLERFLADWKDESEELTSGPCF